MKKLLNAMLLLSIPSTFITQVVSCKVKEDINSFLNGFSNFQWSNQENGDGIEYDPYDINYQIDSSQSNMNDLGSINPDNYKTYLDYENFSTGFKWPKDIEKQVSTGVPLNKGFMPNGNVASDFGIKSPAQYYRRLNELLNFDPQKDMDAKYAKSNFDIRDREFVAAKTTDSQDDRVNFNLLSYNSQGPSTNRNTIVGSKNPFETTQLNWQFNNVFVGWSGSWYEGPIIPPPADNIESAHKQGAKIYGNIFLDGFHGLTKEMLQGFLKKDEQGNFLIVDKLIEIANYFGFDGWFINNEANGFAADGTILNTNDMLKIVQEFNRKTSLSEDKKIRDLNIIYYQSWANLEYDETSESYTNYNFAKFSKSGYKDNNINKLTSLQLDFGHSPGSYDRFLRENPDYKSSDIYTIIDGGYNVFIHGTYNYKNLIYPFNLNGSEAYDKTRPSSFSGFYDGGSAKFAEAVDNILGKEKKGTIGRYLLKNQINALYNDIIYSGTNMFISNSDKGLNGSEYGEKVRSLSNFASEAISVDPRIHWNNKPKQNVDMIEKIFNYNSNASKTNTSSLGIGSFVREKTVFIDKNIENSFLKTNFSTGGGVNFVEDQNTVFKNYPWLNRRLTDILPTYKWRIFDTKSPDTALPIDEIAGGYDYYDIYNKGNSIVIGSGFDQEGKILPATWDTNKTYGWDIIGTNIKKDNNTLSLVYKDNAPVESKSDVNIRLTFADSEGKPIYQDESKVYKTEKIENLSNDWKRITINLAEENLGLNENKVLARIGLNIKPKSEKFKFNVGELNVQSNNFVTNQQEKNFRIFNPKSEYVIYRNYEDQVKNSIRFNWEVSDENLVDYYQIYVFKDNKWFRIGETSQTAYYLKDLLSDNGIEIGMRPVYKSTGKKGDIYKFKINL
ncbi:endo-beta-N-acetylglucosaminidase [Spiroplasma tabanidicola]|uniref:Endo-beta-N-acetylglucosaminidase n=1 Tax=Spiroplasma tabanidicola TaxID=324079 RepID=A0A6I6CD07_9MOLU|nr:hypothetical protein [Spiroplasma tabanidicola]QGS52178.1 endo-beta-N-acetylglucosaminidase [Spiroplasma tabanidicola]